MNGRGTHLQAQSSYVTEIMCFLLNNFCNIFMVNPFKDH
jgi:hypothetical protein